MTALPTSLPPAAAACPKDMVHGPCGGVRFDGLCELGDRPCPFVDAPVVRYLPDPGAGAVPTPPLLPSAAAMAALLARRPVVVADFPARALDRASLERCADVLVGHVDAVLAGDSGSARVQFPPAYRAALVQARGLPAWTGLNDRDRNRVALEGEVAALADVGVAGVHCVTGDHPRTGHRPDAPPVFDLDSTATAALARAAGHLVSVAESPMAPPADRRAARLRQKEAAGADVCFVNHCGGAGPVGRFVREARDLGSTSAFIACVPVVLDHASAALLRSFTTLVLPEGFLDGILDAADPHAAGIEAAVDLAAQVLAVDGVSGVDLSGGPGPGAETPYAEALAEIADRLAIRTTP
ncbi:methylenetetrahydrofolate reductase C-terminal domain-containing protein [Cellulomonas marina]|uniref:5,10-methylenetetrahydrofolate reductase n=1 Tax=Cellulomonas marina TaxID=988821 RepID=A0A1I0V8R7_9CELL|nr:methylenetetrahydrofolate reductase C-terminal domain-containing protein [Cellulomonas marina]GIG29232.1 hypothetical protein Cma02nite_18320 [Cellulomonas marina]SFA72420.1 5,10-methylenetetrahydrofolate reductase [Cellulomonas marina]